ncbi:MAG TPA: aldehyde dehydrogenase family protein, partial [Ilumatobacteraceae bacterium]
RGEIALSSFRAAPLPALDPTKFDNSPDSDFTIAAVRAALTPAASAVAVPHVADVAAIDAAVATAVAASGRWAVATLDARRELLLAVAETMSLHRNESIAVMADEAGKTVREADPEVSEGIDFARYYGIDGTRLIGELAADGITVTPRGVVLVVAPWNFPYAIPAGGVCAALAAGNAVILKPAPETRRTAWELARQLWEAGVPRDLLLYVACDDNEVGRHLVTHRDIATVVLTGSFETAQMFTTWKPDIHLLAETSGKNALIITAAADIDGALKDLVRSAFGHAGQKCSAASLAIVEASVYDDPAFTQRLHDAVVSLAVGWPSEPATVVGPLIAAPRGPLQRALTTLDPGERWLVEPRPLDGVDGRLWTPGVKLGVRPNSWFHLTECFGPVLGVMRADDLEHAITLQNSTPFGLTGGIHSLDPAEVCDWLDRVEVGNAYVNRHITGAVVRRQPFGGWKRSAIGCGAKAGGPDYVLSLCHVTDRAPLDPVAALRSFEDAWTTWFDVEHDPSGLRSERNVLRYRPLRGVILRVDAGTPAVAVELARAAASRCAVALTISDASTESEAALIERLTATGAERIRALVPVGDDLRLAGLERGVGVDSTPLANHGRVELGRWLKEQAISETTHRYGRLTSSVFDTLLCSQRASASPIGVDGAALTIGHSSSAMRR